MVFFVIGSFNFALHYAVLTGKRRELVRNIETVSFTITVTVLTLIATLGLMQLHVYPDIAVHVPQRLLPAHFRPHHHRLHDHLRKAVL